MISNFLPIPSSPRGLIMFFVSALSRMRFNSSFSPSFFILFSLMMSATLGRLQAQTDTTDFEDPNLPLDTFSLADIDSILPTDTCRFTYSITAPVTVHYATQTRVRMYWSAAEVTSVSPVVWYRETGTTSAGTLISFTGTRADFSVPPDKMYEIWGINNCEDTLVVGHFSSFNDPDQAIMVSEPLFDAVTKWSRLDQSAGLDIYDLVSGLSTVDTLEKLSFLQHYIGDTGRFPNALLNSGIPSKNTFGGGPGVSPPGFAECRCKVIGIKTLFEIAKHATPPSDVKPYIDPQIGNGSINWGNNDRGRTRWAYSYEGPSRYQEVWGGVRSGKCWNANEYFVWQGEGIDRTQDSADLSSPSSHFVRMRYAQACVGNNWKPADCPCAQELKLMWHYEAQVRTRAKNLSHGCINPDGRRSLAAADDLAMVSYRKVDGVTDHDMVVLDAARTTASSECEWDFDEKRIVDILKLGFDIFALATGAKVVTNIPVVDQLIDAAWNTVHKNKVKAGLESLLTNKWFKGTNGKCGGSFKIVEGSMEGETAMTLDGNQEVLVVLGTTQFMTVEGRTSWDANARILSHFALSYVLNTKPEPEEEEAPFCCTKPHAFYANSAISTGQGLIEQSNLQQLIGSHIHSADDPQLGILAFEDILPYNSFWSNYVITDEVNNISGNAVPGCLTTINGRSAKDGLQVENSYSLEFQVDGWYLISPADNNPQTRFQLFDVNGKLCRADQVTGHRTRIVGFSEHDLSAGVYLLHLQNPQSTQTLKIVLP